MNLEQQLMHSLRRTMSAMRRHPRGHGGHHHGKPRGFGHILELLAAGDGVSQQQLADRLGIRPQSVSEAVTLLEKRGFARKEASEKDRRVTLIYITGEGRAHAAELAGERKDHAERFFAVLTREEKETLLNLLNKLNAEREVE